MSTDDYGTIRLVLETPLKRGPLRTEAEYTNCYGGRWDNFVKLVHEKHAERVAAPTPESEERDDG